ncbi:MAG: HAD family hydrolase [Mycobacteriales bacterium]
MGLPGGITACLFDLDGVLTSTASVHRAAWKETFDAVLMERLGPESREFSDDDYARFVDGKLRADGVRSFLESRQISLPLGSPDDPPETETINGVGNRKNQKILEVISTDGVLPYAGSVRYLQAARAAGLAIAVVTSSANGDVVLTAAGLDKYVSARIDGRYIAEQKLPGKPAPDSFLAGAAALRVAPAHAVVFEDAIAGVQAGRAGRFGYVVGVNRHADDPNSGPAHASALRDNGADIVVNDLSDLLEEAR